MHGQQINMFIIVNLKYTVIVTVQKKVEALPKISIQYCTLLSIFYHICTLTNHPMILGANFFDEILYKDA